MALKKEGNWCMCPYFHVVNKLTIKYEFPILDIYDLLDVLHGAKFFTEIDLHSGNCQIRMKEVGIPKTIFHTHEGHYEFLVMLFGQCNSHPPFRAS